MDYTLQGRKISSKKRAKAQNKDQWSKIYIKTCENIKKDLRYQLIEDIIVL